MDKDKTLIYTCCDEKYAAFIPIFCAALLSTNSNIDIEIGVSMSALPEEQERALDALRSLHRDATILIDYEVFKESDGTAYLPNSIGVEYGTVRFVVEPNIKDKYTYISDIDVISLDKDFYLSHIEDMKEHDRNYSNIVRNYGNLLTGLHFCLTEAYYPLDLTDIDITKRDEAVLYDIVASKCKLDRQTTFRPVHGIHMTGNIPFVEGSLISEGWFPKQWDYCEDKDNYKKKWFAFKESKEFECIKSTLIGSVVAKRIALLEGFYLRSQGGGR